MTKKKLSCPLCSNSHISYSNLDEEIEARNQFTNSNKLSDLADVCYGCLDIVGVPEVKQCNICENSFCEDCCNKNIITQNTKAN